MKALLSPCLSVLWILFLATLFACDTAKNFEDPDLHYFVKYYGGDGNQYGVDMLALDDGTFLLLGNYSQTTSDSDVYLVRIDAQGDLVWERRFRKDISTAKDLERTSDGNFIVLADFQESIGSAINLKLLKISGDGTLLDSVYFGSNYLAAEPKPNTDDRGRTVTQLDDGGYLVSGTTEFTEQWMPTTLDPGDTFAYRFDANLDLLGTEWGPVRRGFGALQGTQLDVAVKTLEAPNGFFYTFGHTNSNLDNNNPNGRLGLFYFERQPSGTTARQYYPGNVLNVNDTEINFVDRVPAELGDGFLIIGTSRNNIGVSEVFMARLRSSLTFAPPLQNDAMLYATIPLNRNIRGVSAATSVFGELGYLVLGNEVRSTGAANFWLSKVDQSGSVLWSTTFGSEAEDDFGAAVTELPDGKIVVLGTMGLADNQFKMALIKMNPRGQLLK